MKKELIIKRVVGNDIKAENYPKTLYSWTDSRNFNGIRIIKFLLTISNKYQTKYDCTECDQK